MPIPMPRLSRGLLGSPVPRNARLYLYCPLAVEYGRKTCNLESSQKTTHTMRDSSSLAAGELFESDLTLKLKLRGMRRRTAMVSRIQSTKHSTFASRLPKYMLTTVSPAPSRNSAPRYRVGVIYLYREIQESLTRHSMNPREFELRRMSIGPYC